MKMTTAHPRIFFNDMVNSQVAHAPVRYLSLAQSNFYTNACRQQGANVPAAWPLGGLPRRHEGEQSVAGVAVLV
jgi:hypothetical protein